MKPMETYSTSLFNNEFAELEINDLYLVNGGQDVKCQGCQVGYIVGQFFHSIFTHWGEGAHLYDQYRRETGFGK
ncbi:hypothetical protein [Spirosoma sp.]|uniref:hypothetical protein n=1 Tax=Spirosoma sp. TaxID=1899569 RepID=UPI00261EEA49|nr:hypothetical protein [Spirosoma sp.]MCX6214934.1 hypothetical protein [Spirosoma sp.]